MFPKFKLVEIESEKVLTYGENSSAIFGGEWGQMQREGKAEWKENIIPQSQIDDEQNKKLIKEIKDLEEKQDRKIREMLMEKYANDKSLRSAEMLSLDEQITNLRNKIKS